MSHHRDIIWAVFHISPKGWIYLKMMRFTENDAMYSNMIREGQISRYVALERCKSDNIQRTPSLNKILYELGITLNDLNKILSGSMGDEND